MLDRRQFVKLVSSALACLGLAGVSANAKPQPARRRLHGGIATPAYPTLDRGQWLVRAEGDIKIGEAAYANPNVTYASNTPLHPDSKVFGYFLGKVENGYARVQITLM